jgi:hypothetical protein
VTNSDVVTAEVEKSLYARAHKEVYRNTRHSVTARHSQAVGQANTRPYAARADDVARPPRANTGELTTATTVAELNVVGDRFTATVRTCTRRSDKVRGDLLLGESLAVFLITCSEHARPRSTWRGPRGPAVEFPGATRCLATGDLLQSHEDASLSLSTDTIFIIGRRERAGAA